MVAGDYMRAVGELKVEGVGEPKAYAGGDEAGAEGPRQEAIEGDAAEADDHTEVGEEAHLFVEPGGAVVQFFGSGHIGGRGAPDDGRDPQVVEGHAVMAGDGEGLGSEAGLGKDGEEEVAGAVAGEGAAGAGGAVGSGGEAEDEDAGARIAEGRNGMAPVFLIDVGFAPGGCDGGAMIAQAGAARAGDDAVIELLQTNREGGGR